MVTSPNMTIAVGGTLNTTMYKHTDPTISYGHIKMGSQFKVPSNRIEKTVVNKAPYMIAHVLLNLLNKLGKRDKMQGLPSILSLFRNEFNKFNNT